MLVLVLILVLIAFGLLVVALLSASALWAWVSVAVSVVAAGVLLVDWLQRRAEVRGIESQQPAQPGAGGWAGWDADPVTEQIPVIRPETFAAEEAPTEAVGLPPGSPQQPPGAPAWLDHSRDGLSQRVTESSGDPSAESPPIPVPTSAVDHSAAPTLANGVEPAATLANQPPATGHPNATPPPAEAPTTAMTRQGSAPAGPPTSATERIAAPTETGNGKQPGTQPATASSGAQGSTPADSTATDDTGHAEQTVAVTPPASGAAAADEAAASAGKPGGQSGPAGAAEAAAAAGATSAPADAARTPASTTDKPAGKGAAEETVVLPVSADAEPPEEPRDPGNAALVAELDDVVIVIDERPRYHVSGCRFLSGRTEIPLPVREAVELGFTPCGWCNPDRTLSNQHRATSTH